jgi:two-component system chemotaxis response regulator CheY
MSDTHQFSSTGAPLSWEKTPNAKLNVLIVDDFEDARKLTCSVLRQFSSGPALHPIEAEDGLKALAILEKESIDLILADWIMPEMNGLDMLKEIRQREKTKNIPVIMLTAMANEEDVVKAIKAGVTSYIVKPFTIQSLEEKIKAALKIIAKKNGEG